MLSELQHDRQPAQTQERCSRLRQLLRQERLATVTGPTPRQRARADTLAAIKGLALAQLYVDTRIGKYLDGAVRLGLWIAGRESPSITGKQPRLGLVAGTYIRHVAIYIIQ